MNIREMDWKSSSTHVLFNPRMPASEVRDIELRLNRLQPLESHLWIATSGSTAQVAGQLKWIALSKEAILASARAVNRHLEASSSDVWVNVLPGFHVGGIGIFARAYLSRAQVVDGLLSDTSENKKWDAGHFYSTCLEKNGTLSALVPTQIYDLVQAGLQAPSSLRAIVVGGGALSESLYLEARRLGWPLLPSYGMTECCSQIATASLQSLALSPPSFPDLELLHHVEAKPSSDGRLKIQSSSLLTGLAVLSSDGDRWLDPKIDGWFQSEDMGEIFGRILKIRGRGSDFVKIGGESVDISRLSTLLTEIRVQARSSLDLVIIPIEDERLEYVIHGVAACSADGAAAHEAQKLFEQFNSRVLPFERARKLHFVARIPRSPLQKLLKSELLSLIR